MKRKVLLPIFIFLIFLSCKKKGEPTIESTIIDFFSYHKPLFKEDKIFLVENGIENDKESTTIKIYYDFTFEEKKKILKSQNRYGSLSAGIFPYNLMDEAEVKAIQECRPLFWKLEKEYGVKKIYFNLYNSASDGSLIKFGEFHFPDDKILKSNIDKESASIKELTKFYSLFNTKNIVFKNVLETTKNSYVVYFEKKSNMTNNNVRTWKATLKEKYPKILIQKYNIDVLSSQILNEKGELLEMCIID